MYCIRRKSRGFDQEEVEAFLQGKASSSGTGEIIGILEQMGEEMAADLKEATESENASLADFNGLVAAKNKEIQAATTAIEDKTARVGQLAVDIVDAYVDSNSKLERIIANYRGFFFNFCFSRCKSTHGGVSL